MLVGTHVQYIHASAKCMSLLVYNTQDDFIIMLALICCPNDLPPQLFNPTDATFVQTITSANDMHQALSIIEINTCIIDFADRRAAAACACVCKLWSEIALDKIWRKIDLEADRPVQYLFDIVSSGVEDVKERANLDDKHEGDNEVQSFPPSPLRDLSPQSTHLHFRPSTVHQHRDVRK